MTPLNDIQSAILLGSISTILLWADTFIVLWLLWGKK
jgi:hypothetical protein